jgi:enamine deaminase RidA (YjgF/YER057c/UK114 family)
MYKSIRFYIFLLFTNLCLDFLKEDVFPARSAIGVAQLPRGALVEIEVLALE